jgi:hypothetical protein
MPAPMMITSGSVKAGPELAGMLRRISFIASTLSGWLGATPHDRKFITQSPGPAQRQGRGEYSRK